MIDAIQVAGICGNMFYDENKLPLKYLPNVNKINIFIGENNSGKSRMMRALVNSDIANILCNSFGNTRTINDIKINMLDNIKK